MKTENKIVGEQSRDGNYHGAAPEERYWSYDINALASDQWVLSSDFNGARWANIGYFADIEKAKARAERTNFERETVELYEKFNSTPEISAPKIAWRQWTTKRPVDDKPEYWLGYAADSAPPVGSALPEGHKYVVERIHSVNPNFHNTFKLYGDYDYIGLFHNFGGVKLAVERLEANRS